MGGHDRLYTHRSSFQLIIIRLMRLAWLATTRNDGGDWHELVGDLSKIVAIGKKPLDRILESVSECMFRFKAKELLGTADIQAPSRLSIGLGDVPIDLSCKTDLRGNHLGKIANRDFFPCSQIDW